MRKETFDKLPIGTITINYRYGFETIKMKISNYKLICVGDTNPSFLDQTGNISEINDYQLMDLVVAPKWIQDIWRVK